MRQRMEKFRLQSCGNFLRVISDSATGTGADGQKEAISDENVPSPPEDESEDSDTEDNNDMQSEGLTNEEAGLE